MVIYLTVNAALYLFMGAWCALKPHQTAKSIGFTLNNLQGIAEYTAVYGGLELGLGAFFFLGAYTEHLRYPALLMSLCLYSGLVVMRVFAIINHGGDIQNGWYFLALEVVLLIWAALLFSRS